MSGICFCAFVHLLNQQPERQLCPRHVLDAGTAARPAGFPSSRPCRLMSLGNSFPHTPPPCSGLGFHQEMRHLSRGPDSSDPL